MAAIAVDNDSVEPLIAAYRNADGVFVHLPQAAASLGLRHADAIADAVAAETSAKRQLGLTPRGVAQCLSDMGM